MNPNFVNIGTNETKVIEECSEVIKAICKADRFGYDSHHPDRPNITNKDELLSEIKDLQRSLKRLAKSLEKEQTINDLFDAVCNFADDCTCSEDPNNPICKHCQAGGEYNSIAEQIREVARKNKLD